MAIRIGINGFGRIGRLTFRNLVRAVQRIRSGGSERLDGQPTLATLLKYDSIHGRFCGQVGYDAENLIVDGKKVRALAEKDPAQLPWGAMNVDIVIESTGRFTDRAAAGKPGYDTHLAGGRQASDPERAGQGRRRFDVRPGRERRQADPT
jgi:glyceraldehyde 3-phosphate dehydrogenase